MKLRILYTLLLSAVLGMTACTRELNIDEETFEGEIPITFSLPASRGAGIDPEDEIREVRLIVFQTNSVGIETGELLMNVEQQVAAGNTSIDFKVTVPVGYINIYVIANETASNSGVSSLANISSVAEIKAKTLSYSETKVPTAPFLMYGEFKRVKVNANGSMTMDGAPFPAAPNHKIEIQRTVSKVTLDLQCVYDEALLPGTELFVDEIKVVDLPKKPHLVPNHPYTGEYYEEAIYNNQLEPNPKLNNSAIEAGMYKNTQDFYIPEHIVREAGTKTQLVIKAHAINSTTKNKVDGAENIWHIVLGDGIVGKTFEEAHDITGSGLNVTRNTHYKITAKISSLKPNGNLAVDVLPFVRNWNNDSFEVDFDAPYLNVSTIYTSLSIYNSVRVYFWSNQEDVILYPLTMSYWSPGGPSDKEEFIDDVFYKLFREYPDPKFSYSYNATTNSGTGFFDIMFNPILPRARTQYKISLYASLLGRDILINSPWSRIGGEADLLYFDPDGRLQVGKWGEWYPTENRPVRQENIAFFKFGSVIGFTTLNENDSWDKVPTDQRVVFNTTGSNYSVYSDIPCFDPSTVTSLWPGYNILSHNDRINISRPYLHTGEAVKAGRGDPCKLVGLTGEEVRAMSKMEIENYKSGWRMPNDLEQAIFCGLEDAALGFFSNSAGKFPYYTNAIDFPQHSTTPGQAMNPSGARLPIGGGISALQDKNRTFNEKGEYLPATGQRDDIGAPQNLYRTGSYWSNVVRDGSTGCSLNFDEFNIIPRGGGPYNYGRPIRCVRMQ